MRYILTLLLSFSLTSSFAQKLFAVTDFQNCGMGLKDSATGKWVVEPIYQDIKDCYNGFFIVELGSKEGVLNDKGQLIIPVIYDYVIYCDIVQQPFLPEVLFKVINKKRYGLIDQNGKVIIPVTCRYVSVYEDGTITAETQRKRWTIYHRDGTAFPIRGKLPETPRYLSNHLFSVSKRCFGIEHDYFIFFSGKIRYGMINDSAREIIPRKYSEVSYEPDTYKTVYVKKKNKVGYYDTNGNVIWPSIFSEIHYGRYFVHDEWGRNISLMNGEGYTPVKYRKKLGIIGVTGDTILSFEYDDIDLMRSSYRRYRNDFWKIRKGRLYGIYQPATRKWIVPLEYEWINPIKHFQTSVDSSEVDLLLVIKNGKYGIISTSGQVILPPEYDNYDAYHGFILTKGNEYYSVSFPQVIRNDNESYNDYYYDSMYEDYVVTMLPKDGQLKRVEAKNGAVLFINPELISDTSQTKLYHPTNKSIYINPQTYDSLLHATAIVIQQIQQTANIPGIGPVYVAHKNNLHLRKDELPDARFCINPKRKWDFVQTIRPCGNDSFYQYFDVHYSGGVYRSDGKIILHSGQYQSINQRGTKNGLAYFTIDSHHNKTGVIDGNGKLLIDTAWYQIGEMKGNFVMVKKKSRIGYYRDMYSWNILDTSTHQLLLPKKYLFDNGTDMGSQSVVLDLKNGPKLYDMKNRKFLLSHGVNNIISIDDEGNFFYVRTCSGKMGIIGGDGKWLTDTIWNTYIHAYTDSTFKMNVFSESNVFGTYKGDHSSYRVLSNDTGWIIFDGKRKIMTKDPETMDYLLTRSKNSFLTDSIRGIYKFSNNSPSWYFANDSLKTKKLLSWQKKVLFDSLFTAEHFIPDTNRYYYHHVYSCKDCKKQKTHYYFEYEFGKNYDDQTLNHTVRFSNDSVLSVTRENFTSHYFYGAHPSDIFFTVMLFKDGPHNMLLDSLFTGTEWKTFITKQVMDYLDSDLYVKGNCSNPYMMALVLKDRFSFSENGLVLFPPGYKEKNEQLAILVPWRKLKPYLRKDVASKLNVK